MISARLVGLVVLTVGSGCAPSLSSLVEGNHFDEAFAAVPPDAGPRDRDRALVTRAAFQAANPAIHLRAVSAQEIEAQLGSVGRHLEDGWVVRFHTSVTPAPFDTEVRIELRADGGPVAELDRSLEGLATKTGERARAEAARAAMEADDRRQHRAQLDADARARERAASWDQTKQTAWIMTNILTAGTPLIVDWMTGGKLAPTVGGAPQSVQRQAPAARPLPRDAAPDAARLFDALARPANVPTAKAPTHVDDIRVFRRTAPSAALSLRVVVLMQARASDVGLASSTLAAETIVKLPPGPTFEARLEGLFRDRELRLADLGAARVIVPWATDEKP